MRRTFKYRLYPNRVQQDFLNGELREACSLYNCALEERIGAWKSHRKSINYYDQANQLKAMRADGCLTLANYGCCQDVLRRVDKTFKAFFARVKRGDKAGFPRFKPSRRYDSITFPSYGDGCRLFEAGKLRIQGAVELKVKLHRPVEGKIKTVSIKREAGRWLACFSVEIEPEPLIPSPDVVGIDVGLTDFATFSDGVTVSNPRYRKAAQRKLRIAQRKVARRRKGSHGRRQAVQILQRQHAHIQNQRSDFHHKVSREVVSKYGTIVVEDLNIRGLASGMLAKSVQDAGWGYFLQKLAYKAESAGRRFVKVDPRGSSQICICGHSVPKTLRERWHLCPSCGLSGSRDHVSSRVILSRAGTRPVVANVEVAISCVDHEAVGGVVTW
jgi:putative transposase